MAPTSSRRRFLGNLGFLQGHRCQCLVSLVLDWSHLCPLIFPCLHAVDFVPVSPFESRPHRCSSFVFLWLDLSAAGGYNPENPALGPRPPFPMPPFPGVPSNPSRGDFNGKKPCFQFRSGQCTSGDSKYSRISLELDWFHLCPLRFPCLHEEMCCQSKHTSSQSLRWCYARTLLTLTPQVPLCHSLSCILLCALSLIVRSFLPANHENPFYRFVSFVFDYECCLFFFFFFSLFC
eukprot:m.180302 g.180302  ORF g.180302 m.180302 type:complete len:234 (-) comp53441_c0_seq38:151-852(-)